MFSTGIKATSAFLPLIKFNKSDALIIDTLGVEKQLLNFGVKTRIFNAILSQVQFEKSPLVDYYQSRGAIPVICNKEELISEGYYVLQAPLYSRKITPTLRHDPRRLARAVMFINKKLKRLNE